MLRQLRALARVPATLAVLCAISAQSGQGVPVVHAATTWDIDAPAENADEHIEINAFLPSVITINVGDTVRWTVEDAHTVTFPGATGNPAALPQFVPGEPFPNGRVSGAGFSPIGTEGPYDGASLVSSGRLVSRDNPLFSLTFTAAGVFRYLCLVHVGMSGTVVAVPAGAALPETPAQVQARGQAEATAILNNMRAGAQTVVLADAAAPSGTAVHTVAAGISNGSGGSATRFAPAALTVQRGDLVAWELTDPLDAHTITFTSGAPVPDFVEVVPQPDGTVLFAQRAELFGPAGGTTYTGVGLFNSGQLLGGARGRIAFVAAIDAPAGTYQYVCLIHPEMSGTITVTE